MRKLVWLVVLGLVVLVAVPVSSQEKGSSFDKLAEQMRQRLAAKKAEAEKPEKSETTTATAAPAKVAAAKSETLTSVVEAWFKQEEWKFEKGEGGLYTSAYEGDNGTFNVFHNVNDETEQVYVLVQMQSNIPQRRRAAVAEFLMRATYGLSVGNFEMDFEDGEVRFRVGIDVEGGKLTAKQVGVMTGICLGAMDRYAAGVLEVSSTSKSPKEVVEKIESADAN